MLNGVVCVEVYINHNNSFSASHGLLRDEKL